MQTSTCRRNAQANAFATIDNDRVEAEIRNTDLR